MRRFDAILPHVQHEWQIPRSQQHCTGCQRAFDVLEALHAFIYDSSGQLERRDFCGPCSAQAPEGAVGSWRTRRPEPASRKTPVFDRQGLFEMFESLASSDDRQRCEFRFVLALLLWRKRVLKLQATDREGPLEIWQFIAPHTAQAYRVERPDLDESRIEQLSRQLEELTHAESAAEMKESQPASS